MKDNKEFKKKEIRTSNKGDGRTLPSPPKKDSYLADETPHMEIIFLEKLRQGHSQFAKVDSKPHVELNVSAEESYENEEKKEQHPRFKDAQNFDGDEVTPITSPEVIREYKKKREEARVAKELRLGLNLQPGKRTAPTPMGN